MEEEKNKSNNNITEDQENILKHEIKFIHEEFKNKLEEHKRLKEELKNVKKSFHMGLNDYTREKNLTIEKEQEIESLLSKISKMLKMMSLSINQTINKKFYTHLLEISNNRNKEKILLKFFNFLFNVYNYGKIYINNKNIGNDNIENDDYFIDINKFVDNTQSVHELLTIIRNENEIKNILVYSYDIFHNLQKENEDIYLIIKKSYFELFNEINNTERQYPLDFLFDFMKNNFNIIDLEKQVEELKNSLNKLIQEKNAKFVEVKNIESVIKTYNRNCKIISNYIKALKSFYYRIKDQNNINSQRIKNNDAIKELIENIKKFKKLRLDYDKFNSNFDAMTSLSFGTNYTLSEKSSIKSSVMDSKNNEEINSDNENINIYLNPNENKEENHKDNNNKDNSGKSSQNKEKKIEPKTNKNKIAINKKDNININVNDINNKNENDNKLMNKMINKSLANKSINLNKSKNFNKNNNSYIGKRNNKTLDKKNISLSKQNMKVINMNNLTSTDYSTNANNKSQIKKQLNTRSFVTYKNKNPKKNSSFNKETKNKKLNTNDQKIFQNKIKAQKTLNNKQVNKRYKANNNSSHNYSNIIKNKNIIKISNDKFKKKDKEKDKDKNISINNKTSTQILESKNTTTFDDLSKTKYMKEESNRTQIEKGDKNLNPILSPASYTNTIKIYNPSEKNTEKEFDKPFLLNSNQKYDFNGNNRYNISKKIEQLKKKEPEDYIEIIMPNKENNVNDEYFDPNNMKDSICDEMISQNFGTANSLFRSTTNDYINRLGFKNNVLWSENLYRNKALKFKSNFKKLNIEKPIDTSSCCASCT